MSTDHFSILLFLGALAIFLYGMRIGRIGLQLAGGERLRAMIASLTENRFYGVGVGALTTLILQSSTAMTVMLVGLAGSQLITLTQAMGVILGADVGTTLIVFLLSVKKVADYALVILIVGVLVDLLAKKKRTRYFSMVILGFGFVFFAMNLMVQAMAPLRQNPWVTPVLETLSNYPIYIFLAATLFTAVVQSSATTIGLAMALAFGGTLSIHAAVPIIFGANVGTCVTAFLAGLGGSSDGKRVAWSHLLFKIGGVLLVAPFLDPFIRLVQWVTPFIPIGEPTVARQLAVSHLIFNLSVALIFLPFIRPGVWLVQKLFPDTEADRQKKFGPKYLDPSALETPALAFAHVKREILRMADIAYEMFREVPMVFETNNLDKIDELESKDNHLDILNKEVKFYLAKISQSQLSDQDSVLEVNYLSMVSDLEEIGDIINKHLMELAEKKILKGREFSQEGWKEIRNFHAKVVENFDLAVSSMTTGDQEMAKKVIRHDSHMREIERELRQAHLNRLHQGLRETFETSSIHLDVLANFQRINNKITAVVMHAFPQK
ncbi:MAG: Na/Pi cotransporter family protein, partial [Deltaproteobacteria bacterium]|nr:Na/Pi cotransporter family protein [Deltaproteobacteria bacterium]